MDKYLSLPLQYNFVQSSSLKVILHSNTIGFYYDENKNFVYHWNMNKCGCSKEKWIYYNLMLLSHWDSRIIKLLLKKCDKICKYLLIIICYYLLFLGGCNTGLSYNTLCLYVVHCTVIMNYTHFYLLITDRNSGLKFVFSLSLSFIYVKAVL